MTDVGTPDELYEGEHGWQANAACAGADPELFFPARGEPTATAKAVCATCPVRDPCREYALARTEKFGIWGGLSERERRALRRRRRRGT